MSDDDIDEKPSGFEEIQRTVRGAWIEAADPATEEKVEALPPMPAPAGRAYPKSFVPGIDFDPQLEHLVYATTEPEAVVLRTKLTTDEELRERDLNIVERLKAKGSIAWSFSNGLPSSHSPRAC